MSMPDTSSELKIVIVGDGAVRNRHYNNNKELLVSLQVGKTCFCTVFAKKEFPSGYVPTIFESHPVKRTLFEKVCWLKESLKKKRKFVLQRNTRSLSGILLARKSLTTYDGRVCLITDSSLQYTLNRLSYGGADAFIVCYSTVNKLTLKNIREKVRKLSKK